MVPAAPWGPGPLTIGVGVRSLLVGHDTGCGIIDLLREREGEGEDSGGLLGPTGRPSPVLNFSSMATPRGSWELGERPPGTQVEAWDSLCCQPGPHPGTPCCPASRDSWYHCSGHRPAPAWPRTQALGSGTMPSPTAFHFSIAVPTNQAPASLWQPKVTGEAGRGTVRKVLSGKLTDPHPNVSGPGGC